MEIIVFGDLTVFAAAHLRRLLADGHRVTAFVTAERTVESRLKRERRIGLIAPRWSVSAQLRKAGIPLIPTRVPVDAEALANRLKPFGGEALVSVAFGGRIPSAIRALYRRGAINVHPALLPDYRGPNPGYAMLLDGTLETSAGVSVHVMTDAFDEGPVLAQSHLRGAAALDPDRLDIALARLGAALLGDTLKDLDRRMREAQPQPEGSFRSARLRLTDLTFGPGIEETRLAALLRVVDVQTFPRLRLDDRILKVMGPLKRLGPANGTPPKLRAFSVDFDTRDTRVRLTRVRAPQKQRLTLQRIARLAMAR